jgi:outer membrane protein TolC
VRDARPVRLNRSQRPDYVAPKTTLEPFHNVEAVSARKNGDASAAARSVVDRLQRSDARHDRAARAGSKSGSGRGNRPRRAGARHRGRRGCPAPADRGLNASASVQRQSLNSPLGVIGKGSPGYNRYQREFAVGPAASWELDLFGGLRRGANAAGEEAQAAEADHAGTRISVAADAADAYLQIRGYQARLAVAQDQIDTDAHLLSLVEERHRLGQATGGEIAQAEALLKQARASLPPLRIGLEAQLNRLDVLMGVQPGTYARELAAPSEIPAIPAIGGDDRPIEVLRRRPDIIAAERRLAASNEQIGVAIADYYPKISLSATLGFDSASVSRLFTAKAFQPIGAGALRWRLFDFG